LRSESTTWPSCTETAALIDSGHALARSGRPDLGQHRWRQAHTITEQTGDPRIAAIDTLLAGSTLATNG